MKLVVLGCGNMMSALLAHLRLAQTFTYDPIADRAQALAQAVGGQCFANLAELPTGDIYLLGCKPQQFASLAADLRPILPPKATIVSIMAGISTSNLVQSLGIDSVVRVMPNAPALIGQGVSAVYFAVSVPQHLRSWLEQLLEQVSAVFVFGQEEMIDVVTGFSGSGPAYIFEIARIMIEKLKAMGMTHIGASKMIKQTMLGATHLMIDNDPVQLRDMVTSSKGVTAAALDVFRESQLENIFAMALEAAHRRALDLAK